MNKPSVSRFLSIQQHAVVSLLLTGLTTLSACGGGGSSDASSGAPTASSSSVMTAEDVPVSSILTASDAEGDPLTFSVVSNGSMGTATITNAAAGAFTYTPSTDAFGTDSFTFKANDGSSDSNTATVTVTITATEDPPVASPSNLTIDEDSPANGTLDAQDPDGDPLTYRIVTNGSKGTATITDTATGAFTYTPNADAFGGDAFTFAVNDGVADSNTATVSVTINPVNDPPVANAGCSSTRQAQTLNGTLGATDPESPALLLYRLEDGSTGPFTTAKGGTVTITDDTTGAFSYKPLAGGERGTDLFNFRVTDPDGAFDTATETVIVDQAIMPLGDSITGGTTIPGAIPEAERVGYRQDLYLTLLASGFTADVVGTLDFGYAAVPDFDSDHEGHGGWTAADIAFGQTPTVGDDGVFAWLNANPADFILLHAGTNGLDPNGDIDIEAILDEIARWETSANGNPVTVLLALIIDQNPINPDVTTFNNNVLDMVNNRAAARPEIIIVNQHDALNYPGDLADWLHPNATGYSKMANTWFTDLQSIVDKCP